jgi:ankyrin repeat protein
MKKVAFIFLLFFWQKIFAQEACITSLEKRVLQAINDFRKEKGLDELKTSKILMLTANKNAETMANGTYTDFKVTQFGNYTGRTQRVKMATSVTTYEQIVSTLISPSQYNKNAKILGNTDEFAQFKWKAIGISLRKSNDTSVPMVICVYVGESEEELFNPKNCSQEELYFSPNLKPQPDRVEVVKPKERDWRYIKINVKGRVAWFLDGFNPSKKIDKTINNLVFDRFNDSLRHARYNDNPNYAVGTIQIDPDNTEYEYYEIHYYPELKPIVPQKFVFKISREELKKSSKDIWYNLDYQKGNTLAELKEYLNQDPKNLSLTDKSGYTVFHRAVEQNSLECVDYLLNEKNVNVNLAAKFGVIPMSLCKSEKMFDLLMSKKPNMALVDNVGYTMLHCLALNNVLKGVKYMVEVQKSNLNAIDRQKGTALHHAVMNRNYEIVEYLVKKGARQTIGWGGYPIHHAIDNHDIKTIKFLLENGGKPHINLPKDNVYYPLYMAIMGGNMEIIKLVVENGGANLNQMMKDPDGKVFRIVDFYKNHPIAKPEIIEYLKSRGAKF